MHNFGHRCRLAVNRNGTMENIVKKQIMNIKMNVCLFLKNYNIKFRITKFGTPNLSPNYLMVLQIRLSTTKTRLNNSRKFN